MIPGGVHRHGNDSGAWAYWMNEAAEGVWALGGHQRGSETRAEVQREGSRRSLLYAVAVLLLLMLILSVTGHLLQLRPAALVGFPVTIIAITALILVLLVLAEPGMQEQEAGELLVDGCFLPSIAVSITGGEIVAANAGAVKLLQVDLQARKLSLPDLIGKDLSEENRRIVQRAVDEGYAEATACSVATVDGGHLVLDLLARVDRTTGSDLVVVAFREAQQTDAVERFARVQERLMSNISHEVRTPLNVLLGFSELFEAGTLGELNRRQVEAAHEMHAGGQRILSMIEDILDVGRARSYEMEDEVTVVDPAGLLDRVETLLIGQARRAEIRLHFETADVQHVEAEERILKQLAYHLVLNSLDRSKAGDMVSVIAEASDRFILEVTDAGPMVRRQPEPLRVPTAEGDAEDQLAPPVVGLTLCATLAERLGGHLYVSSDAEGVHFCFEKPLNGEPLVG